MTPAEARRKLDLSQREMAQAMGVHYMTWRKWERGERRPDNAAVRLMSLLCWLHEKQGPTLAQWLEALEDARLIDAFDVKLARGDEELIPEEYAERLIGGENPVRVWRELRDMTLQQVADACGATDSLISMIEQGQRQPSVGLLKRLAAALGIEPDDLL